MTGTLCNLTCKHCFISCSPHNHSFGFLDLATIHHSLDESVGLGVKEYYFTGGEPFLHPDMAEILELIRVLGHTNGMAVLFVTHDWGVVADICDRAMVLFRGQVLETATVLDIFERPKHPYTAALLKANPHAAPPGQPLPTVEETLARMDRVAA